MASQPSVYNEERNRLRLRAWEQRNQETSQTKNLNSENVPLFGEPYKTNKGDELSSRIQKMLGSYEDVNNSNHFSNDTLPSPYASFSQSEQCQPDKSTKASFPTRIPSVTTQSQKDPSNSHSSQSMRTSSASSSPNTHRPSSTVSKASLNPSEGSQLAHLANEQKPSEAFSDLRNRISLPTETAAQSLDTKSLEFLHSSDNDKAVTDTKDTIDRHQLQGSTDHISASSSNMDVSTLKNRLSPKDTSLPHVNKTNVLPSQTFSSLLSSKQPSVAMTQKPTAYVRPMDGQEQVVSESPDLKPSPEPYEPIPELINKSDLGKLKILPQFFETNEAQCVEEILREMTHSWPPLLTAIHTPSTDELSKSPKDAEHAGKCPVQHSSPRDPSQLNQQSSLLSLEAAHSSGVESTSSSDSESGSRSESDSESAAEEPSEPIVSSSVKTEPDAPAVNHGDWQLWNWIRSNQQRSSTENQGGELGSNSPAHKQPVPIQSSKHSSVDVHNAIRESKLPSPQKQLNNNVLKTQQLIESSQDKYNQPSCQQSPSVDSCKISCNGNFSKQAKAECPDQTEAALNVKCDEPAATRVKDPSLTDRPKGKTKTKHSKKSKDGGETNKDSKRTLKHMSLDKRKTEPEPEPKVALVMHGPCLSCGLRHPNHCSCPTQNPAQPGQKYPGPTVQVNCSKVKLEPTCQKVTKLPHKTSHKHSEKTGHTVKGSRDLIHQPISLLVKIELSLLSRVPKTSRSHQEMPNNEKTSALVTEQRGGDGDVATKHKRSKTSKKSSHQNAEVNNKSHPRKKQKLENKNTSSTHGSAKLEHFSSAAGDQEQKKVKKNPVQSQKPVTPKNTSKDLKLHKHCVSGDTRESSRDAAKKKDSKHKKKSVKQTERPNIEKQKNPKVNIPVPPASHPNREASTHRPLLKFEDRQYPVKHYIKEAKRLKHKADAEVDKMSKAFSYLDAAIFFVESGIAMEKDPQISMSSYAMFADTVELLKFILKLKNPVDPSTPPSEKDFLALCLKCQSLLQMAMFRHKQEIALEYSKTLTDHFNAPHDPSTITLKTTLSPIPSMSSPAGPGFNHIEAASSVGLVGSTVAVPRAIEQVTFTYVNITTLFLNAHDIWEQAEELAHKGTGILAELDIVMGPLSLTSTISSMVRYTRQGVHWLRLDSQKVK